MKQKSTGMRIVSFCPIIIIIIIIIIVIVIKISKYKSGRASAWEYHEQLDSQIGKNN
jgi:hypothetical protein